MKRNAFGQLIPTSPYLRFFVPQDDANGGGGSGGGDGKEFKAPASQEELDRIVTERVSRAERKAREEERTKFADYDSLKSDAEKFRAANSGKPSGDGGDDGKRSGVSEQDVDKRINDALAAERLELALERVNDRLDKALEGRTYAASTLFALDRKQFVKDDGKSVDADAIKTWVEANSKAVEQADTKRRRIPGQGDRDANATGGSVQSGRDLYDETHKKKSGKD
ncbi:hypothetical protein Q9R08_05165 [Microbacterium sp. QXD-8]|uniref:DUF4355 domain-containing protein n=1 Tax=Microbacterium psychrotolerans TaxID=3068321 RepID=A0ABU0YYF5_9MICO|nr:hypothetical protein [Microbacterium sp. QXD-8]MDQ7877363.1 hypothetical protein [Microbacterium sp. QXD-8]